MGRHDKTSKSETIYKHNASIVKVLGACIFVCLVFCAGFMLRGNTAFLASLGFANLSTEQEASSTEALSGSTYDSISARVEEVESILVNDSINSYDLSIATELMINAISSSSDDSYLAYFDQEAYGKYLETSTDPEAGIGVLFGEHNGACYAVDVFEGSQAANAGVKPGDFVVAIDGEAKESWSMLDAVNALNREEGELAYVSWRRPETPDSLGGETFSTSLPYGKTEVVNIDSQIERNVLYIDIKQLSSDSSAVIEDVITDALSQDIEAIVLDIRNVPGGYLTQAVEIASFFISSGTVVQIKTSDNITTKTADAKTLTDLPLVLIVNGKTSGSAEVLAAALQESRRATVVGVQTQGKGSVQVLQPLSFGGALRYTAATYLTPEGRSIDQTGVSPDVAVSNAGRQKTVALDVALSRAS